MGSSLLLAFKNKKPSKFADEGPPEDDSKETGVGVGGEDSGEAGPPHSMDGPDLKSADGEGMSHEEGGYDAEAKAVDDMADILGVGPEDREDFAAALQTYVHTCVAKALGEEGEEEGGEMGEGMPTAANTEGMSNGHYEGA